MIVAPSRFLVSRAADSRLSIYQVGSGIARRLFFRADFHRRDAAAPFFSISRKIQKFFL
jgi:hypothetical protein